jgi:tRNA threonylcarbamoyladenosine biosynthesis protein TsaE
MQISNGVKFFSKNPNQTKKSAESLVKKILKNKKRKGAFVLGLKGDLGGGKTTFLQGFARGLGIREKVLSPTFVILKKFKIGSRKWKVESRRKTTLNFLLSTFYHIDCYRIQKPREILELGFKEIIKNPRNIVAIEWAERIERILPKNTIWINFEFVDKDKREIKISKF